jgi:hypothetical protein
MFEDLAGTIRELPGQREMLMCGKPNNCVSFECKSSRRQEHFL